ncbi:hypothetical protein [uncultured Caballeronia sp.]|uniref:hypothetical protein n=1 Tax=uncultured Caballeronia sp. TaxID=1827198 RepID=UPI0035CB2031
MTLRPILLSLLVGMSIYSIAYADPSETINVQSHIEGISTPDITPVIARLKEASATATTVRPWTLPSTRFRSQRTSRDTAFTAATVGPPVNGCADIQVGTVYNATTAPSGQTDCFEFVAPDLTKTVGYVASLPANEEHDAHLVQVNSDGSFTYLDNEIDSSQTKIVEGIPGGPVRLLLLVDSQQGTGGATFQFQVTGTTGYDSYEPNDSILHPTQLSGDQQINANLDTVSDVDYYAIQTPTAQTVNRLIFTGTGTQTAQLETAPSTWATLTSGTSYNVTSSSGATLMMRAYNTGTSAPAAQTYSIRLSDGAGIAGFYQFLDTENISHLAPNRENVARTITAGVTAYDHTGNIRLPAGEHVTIQVYDRSTTNVLTLLTTTSGVTNASGNLVTPLNIGVCQGQGTTTGNFATTSTPADHYTITYNPNSFAVAYLDNGALNPGSSYSYFNHICSETYLGRY